MPLNGATSAMIIGEEKEAKKRVLFFILIYFFTGIISKCISCVTLHNFGILYLAFLYGLLNISIQFYYIDEHKNFPTEGQAMKVLYGLMVFEVMCFYPSYILHLNTFIIAGLICTNSRFSKCLGIRLDKKRFYQSGFITENDCSKLFLI